MAININTHELKININIHEFKERFDDAYEFLYDNYDKVAGYSEAVEFGDDFLKRHPQFVSEFARFRGDMLTSDREIAAFAFALMDMIDDRAA